MTIISDLVGQSDSLMKTFANHCCELAARLPTLTDSVGGADNDPYKWGGVLLKVLMSIHNSGQQVSDHFSAYKYFVFHFSAKMSLYSIEDL